VNLKDSFSAMTLRVEQIDEENRKEILVGLPQLSAAAYLDR